MSNEYINILGMKFKKLKFHTCKPEDITPIEAPKMTIEDFHNWEKKVIERTNSKHYIITPDGKEVDIMSYLEEK